MLLKKTGLFSLTALVALAHASENTLDKYLPIKPQEEYALENPNFAQKNRKKNLLDVVTEIHAIQDIIRAYLCEWQTALFHKQIPGRSHEPIIEAELFSPDSNKLAILYQNTNQAKLRIFDLTRRKFILFPVNNKNTLVVHANRAHALDFSPDGSQVATGSWEPEGSAKIWDAQTGTCLYTLNLGNNAIQQVKYSPNGAYLALSGKKNALFKTENFTQVGSNLCTDSKLIDRAFFSPDSTLIAFASKHKNTVHIYETRNSSPVQVIKHPTKKAKINAVLFSADNKQVIIAVKSYTPHCITVWDTQTGKHIQTFDCDGYAYFLAPSPTKNIFATGESITQSIKIWDAQNYTLLKTYSVPFTGDINEVAFSHDGKYIAGMGQNAFIWDTRTGDLVSHVKTENNGEEIKFSGNFKNIAIHRPFQVLQAVTPDTSDNT